MSTKCQPVNQGYQRIAEKIVNDNELLRMVDKEKMKQSEVAKHLGVSRQAVSKRLRELRRKMTRVVVSKKIERVADQKLDAIDQLTEINTRAMQLLDEAGNSPELALKCMAEIRGQLKLQLEIFQALYDVKAVQEFQEEVLTAISEVEPDARRKILNRLNQRRAVRSIVRFS